MDFAIGGPLVRRQPASHPVLVHRLAPLLHASFRPNLAVEPLRFATLHLHLVGRGLSPPSGRTCSAHHPPLSLTHKGRGYKPKPHSTTGVWRHIYPESFSFQGKRFSLSHTHITTPPPHGQARRPILRARRRCFAPARPAPPVPRIRGSVVPFDQCRDPAAAPQRLAQQRPYRFGYGMVVGIHQMGSGVAVAGQMDLTDALRAESRRRIRRPKIRDSSR